MKQKLKDLIKRLFKSQRFWSNVIEIVFMAEFLLVILVWLEVGSDSFEVPILLLLIFIQLLIIPTDESKRDYGPSLIIYL